MARFNSQGRARRSARDRHGGARRDAIIDAAYRVWDELQHEPIEPQRPFSRPLTLSAEPKVTCLLERDNPADILAGATTPPHSSRRHRSAYCKTTVLVYTCEEPSPLISPPGLLETCYCRAILSLLDNVMAAITPPSQIMSVPVRYPALSLAQNARSSAISPGWPKRFRAPI